MSAAVLSPQPYGAAELKTLSRAMMSRATVCSSAAWVVLFFILLAVSPWFPTEPLRVPIPTPTYSLEPPTQIERYDVPRVPPAAPHTAPDHGVIEPVAETDLPKDPPDVPPSAGNATDQPLEGSESTGIEQGIDIGSQGQRELPKRGVYVYVEELPVPVARVTPKYPELAKMAGVTGKVVVDVLVGIDGRVLDTAIADGASIPLLDQAALDAARQWRFKPAFVNQHPVMVWVSVPFSFRMN